MQTIKSLEFQTTRKLIDIAEEGLGFNLVWLSDQSDQAVRQKDAETIRRLAELNYAWLAIVRIQDRARTGSL